ncbi:MAG: methionyl-tRNA formyltransferase [Saprospiraceae bacterium]
MKPRILFMGTPDFSVPALRTLLDHDYEVVGVVTATDKMGGRGGKQLLESAVKIFARERGLTILQPPNLKAESFQVQLRELQPDLGIIVAFRMLPETVWSLPPLGTFNLHGSLLPRYRGAAPINWAVMNGDKKTGVTTFFLRHEIDTGDLLLQAETPIGPNETAGNIYQRLMEIGAGVVLDTVRLIENGKARPQVQDAALATPAPKLFRENCRIDWTRSPQELHDFVRGLHPYPTAWTTLAGETFKVISAAPESAAHQLTPGTLVTDGKRELRVACPGGYLQLLKVQAAGKRRMETADFLNGAGDLPERLE